jgi:hypothetical protein
MEVAVGVLTVAEPDATEPPWGSAKAEVGTNGIRTPVINPAAVSAE